jgi:pimeloyl-ACP methyl ester carboxylesterase
MPSTEARTGYASIGDLEMYYEVQGTGRPLLFLHGAYMTVDLLDPLRSRLAETRQVVAPELQGHGRTADVDRPLTYEQMADDAAALLRALELEEADVLGYSMGGGVALQLALRHPEVVRKLVLASAGYSLDAMHPVALEMFPSISPEMFAGSPIEEAYARLAPNPGDFPRLVEKLTLLDTTTYAWPEEEIGAIAAPTLIVLGDADGIRLEHAVELFRLRGGGAMGDITGLPAAQLAVLPGTSHFVPPGSGVLDRGEWLLPMIDRFLAA